MATKTDLMPQNDISSQIDGVFDKICQELKIESWFKVSAISGANIDESLSYLIRIIINRLNNQTEVMIVFHLEILT
jgi:hypothetical protein